MGLSSNYCVLFGLQSQVKDGSLMSVRRLFCFWGPAKIAGFAQTNELQAAPTKECFESKNKVAREFLAKAWFICRFGIWIKLGLIWFTHVLPTGSCVFKSSGAQQFTATNNLHSSQLTWNHCKTVELWKSICGFKGAPLPQKTRCCTRNTTLSPMIWF